MAAKKNDKEDSCSPPTIKNIRPQIIASHLIASDIFDRGPPFGVQADCVINPVGNQLLANSGTLQEFGDPLCKTSLTSSDLNGALNSGNVSFLHKRRDYTNRLVKVNKHDCVTDNKEACIVLDMSNVAKKQQKKSQRIARIFDDGKTLGQRIHEAMAYKSGQLRREYRQADLLADVNSLAGSPTDQPAYTQQNLSSIIKTGSQSSMVAFIAMACEVNPAWLSRGIGSKIPLKY